MEEKERHQLKFFHPSQFALQGLVHIKLLGNGAVVVGLEDRCRDAYSKPFFGIWQVLSGFRCQGEVVLRLQKVGFA